LDLEGHLPVQQICYAEETGIDSKEG